MYMLVIVTYVRWSRSQILPEELELRYVMRYGQVEFHCIVVNLSIPDVIQLCMKTYKKNVSVDNNFESRNHVSKQ